MKEFINFYYGINAYNLKMINDYYTFLFNNELYYLVPFNQTIDRLNYYEYIANNLYKYNIKSHYIIKNKNGNKITNIDDVSYLLLKTNISNEEVLIFDIIKNQNMVLKENIKPNNNYYSWAHLWKIKVDYLEDTLKEIKRNNIIDYSINYYVGYAESSILYYNNTIKYYYDKNSLLTWCHKRLYYPNMEINYLNPLNYLYDYKERDIAEYIKSAFFYDEGSGYEEVSAYLKIEKLNNYSANLLFARLLYPSYYFDLLEKIINNKISPESLLNIIKKQKQYELFLKKIYQKLSEKYVLLFVDFLK